MQSYEIKIRAMSAPWYSSIELAIMRPSIDNQAILVGKLDWHAIPEFSVATPAVSLNNNQAQVLMDDLWNCGIRPTEGTGSAGAMRATERHLADLQKIVFKGK